MLGIPVDQLTDNRGRNPKARGAESPHWTGGRPVHVQGYRKMFVGCGHPLSDPNGYAYEHLLVWCAAGRRRPEAGEVLHHRNELKDDNRLENLELLSRSEHNRHHIVGRRRDAAGRLLDGVTHDGVPK